MTYREDRKDLFTVPEDYYLAHCISADFGMGKGIVVEFNKRFDMKRKLQTKYPSYYKREILSQANNNYNETCTRKDETDLFRK